MEKTSDRFIRYIKVDTQSDHDSEFPSVHCQAVQPGQDAGSGAFRLGSEGCRCG